MGFDESDAGATTPRRAKPARAGASDAHPPIDPPPALANPTVGDPAAHRAAEDYLDWRDNLRRPPEDVRRVDAFFLILFVVGALVLASIVAAVVWHFVMRST